MPNFAQPTILNNELLEGNRNHKEQINTITNTNTVVVGMSLHPLVYTINSYTAIEMFS